MKKKKVERLLDEAHRAGYMQCQEDVMKGHGFAMFGTQQWHHDSVEVGKEQGKRIAAAEIRKFAYGIQYQSILRAFNMAAGIAEHGASHPYRNMYMGKWHI